MPRVYRQRFRVATFPGGEARINGGALGTIRPTRTFQQACMDYHGRPATDSPLTVTRFSGTYPWVSGTFKPNFFTNPKVECDAFTCGGLPSGMTNLSPIAAPDGWMLDLVAGTNPSRPVNSIPMWAQNIAEYPKMVLKLGRQLASLSRFRNRTSMGQINRNASLKGYADQFLGIKFGWLPLIDDLTKLLDFQKHVLKRDKELAQLFSGKGLSRRLKFSDDSSGEPVSLQTGFYGNATLINNCSLIVRRKSWATIRWKPILPPMFHPDDISRNQLARKLVLGLNAESLARGVWELIPWTWLIGWFTNFGKYTLAFSMTVPATHGAGCFMSSVEATLSSSSATALNASAVNLSHGGVMTSSLKTRIVSNEVAVGVNMPYLDMSRLSVLGALFVQRFFR